MNSNTRRKPALGEPDAHKMMRRAMIVLRILLIIALISTIVLLIYNRPVAHLTAIAIPVLGLVFAFVSWFERQSRASQLRQQGQKVISKDEVDLDVEVAGISTVLEIAAFLVIGSIVAAATIVGWENVGIVAAMLLLLAIFITLPYLPLLVMGAASEEREKVTQQPTPQEHSSKK